MQSHHKTCYYEQQWCAQLIRYYIPAYTSFICLPSSKCLYIETTRLHVTYTRLRTKMFQFNSTVFRHTTVPPPCNKCMLLLCSHLRRISEANRNDSKSTISSKWSLTNVLSTLKHLSFSCKSRMKRRVIYQIISLFLFYFIPSLFLHTKCFFVLVHQQKEEFANFIVYPSIRGKYPVYLTHTVGSILKSIKTQL